ncbi:energy transducer TonB [Antarcticibacterium arcticum]|uniref:Energy transducer TonB n=1 Tax=Antarcticibacterium arcticum TaxID=2585771 RepID=A0A5B8YMY8_9FLAO|nr:energy transducer TonB [Antarcticibacterium arcticum]QED38638.1 energy transducer TonB [Antarcticibacterium arcticum]
MKVKKYAKADIGSYSRIFFQIGLILVLATTYAGLEWEFTQRDNNLDYDLGVFEEDEIDIPISQLNTPPPPSLPEIVQVVEDDLEVEEDIIESTESSQDVKTMIIPVSAVIVAEEVEEIEEVPFFVVEQIPLYPGCENMKVKAEQKKCMENKIHSLFSKEFNTGISEQMGLNGIYRIFVVFKISATGDVVEIKTRGPNARLELEAERVAKLLPKMTPGKQRGKPVAVSYSLPIVFTVLPQS